MKKAEIERVKSPLQVKGCASIAAHIPRKGGHCQWGGSKFHRRRSLYFDPLLMYLFPSKTRPSFDDTPLPGTRISEDMADPTPSASASDSEAPAAHADVEIKSLDANGALSEGDLGTPRGAKRKSPMRSEEDEADMGEAKDELFGDDDSEDVPGTPEDDEDAYELP